MDIVFWIILVVVAAIIIWWLLNRNKAANPPGGSSAGARTDGTRTDGALAGGSAAASAQAAGTTGIPTAAGFGKPAEPAVPSAAEEPADSAATPTPAAHPSDSGTEQEERRRQDQVADQAEWETQWSEAGPGSRSGSSATGAAAGSTGMEPQAGASPDTPSGQASAAESRPVHHDEYTAPHAPTLPGAETAAVESVDDGGMETGGQAPQHRADSAGAISHQEPAAPVSSGIQGDAGRAETLDRTQSSALVENGADHQQPSGQAGAAAAEPTGHLAANEPYGAGSAAPGPDGSGPADYTVKGDAAAMVFYEEGHPDYEQTRAEVWFESAAHAEAAGFRAPRRRRL
ncbi:hypothetical protein ACFFGR_10180 [Arthrobacter liuii]|uniref:Membrane protein ArfC n=1 Tax=Arthrobacter liuii TaxID=1476996 RepID=A0ABQ2ARE4_9MICC|nr:hypothetical protein [Arthrobacter liuii]GGH94352.1 hypothetical protein GCM10007170_17360 [Arthrobacter liuii]